MKTVQLHHNITTLPPLNCLLWSLIFTHKRLNLTLLPMPRTSPCNKTKKAAVKRFRITPTGKIIRARAGRRHLAASKTNRNKRRLARPTQVHSKDELHVLKSLPFGSK